MRRISYVHLNIELSQEKERGKERNIHMQGRNLTGKDMMHSFVDSPTMELLVAC